MPENENTGELHESPLDPAEDERIRRLLADARHTEPMPEAVVARLDRVLAGLLRRPHRDAPSDRRPRRGRRPRGPSPPDRRPACSSPRPPWSPSASASPRSSRTWAAAPTATPRRPRPAVRPPTAPTAGDGEGSRLVSPESAPEAPSDGTTSGAGEEHLQDPLRRSSAPTSAGPATSWRARAPGALVEYPADGLPGRQRRAGQRGRRHDVRRRSRRPGPASALGRRPGRRPVPLRRPRAAAFDHADRALTGPDCHGWRSWGRCDWRGEPGRNPSRATPGRTPRGNAARLRSVESCRVHRPDQQSLPGVEPHS